MFRSRRVLAIGGKHGDYGCIGQGLYLTIFMSYRKFLGDECSKQVASIMNGKDSECVKCF